MLEGSSDPFHRQEQHDPRDARRLGFLRGHRTGPRPGPTWGPHLGAPGVRRGYSVLSFLYSEPSIPLGSRGGGRLWFVQGVPASNDTDFICAAEPVHVASEDGQDCVCWRFLCPKE